MSNLDVGTDHIEFDVDRPGSPVLVKVSYFPSWHASGADGPYRVAPNLRVVGPTGRHVGLSYGREPVDWLGYLVTALGIALVVLLAGRPPLRVEVARTTGEPAAAGEPPPDVP